MRDYYIANSASTHSIKWYSVLQLLEVNPIWINRVFKEPRRPIFRLAFKVYEVVHIYLYLLFARVSVSGPIRVNVQYLGFYSIPLIFLPFRFSLISTVWGSDILINKYSFIKRALILLILKRSTIVTVDCNHILEALDDLHVHRAKVRFVPFGTNVRQFYYGLHHLESSFFKYSESNKCLFISLRQLYRIYGVDEIIQAFEVFLDRYKLIFNSCPFAELHIYADGDQSEELSSLINCKLLTSCVKMKGKFSYENLPNILQEYHYSISASHSDAGLSASIAESMSSGVVPIVNDFGDNTHWVNESCGLVFQTGNVSNLADRMIEAYLISSDKYSNLSTEARKIVVSSLSEDSQLARLADIYSTL